MLIAALNGQFAPKMISLDRFEDRISLRRFPASTVRAASASTQRTASWRPELSSSSMNPTFCHDGWRSGNCTLSDLTKVKPAASETALFVSAAMSP